MITLKQWDWIEDIIHLFIFIMVIGTNVGEVSPWPFWSG
jgi:hypothetical protein